LFDGECFVFAHRRQVHDFELRSHRLIFDDVSDKVVLAQPLPDNYYSTALIQAGGGNTLKPIPRLRAFDFAISVSDRIVDP
jgi:hypothetical protein